MITTESKHLITDDFICGIELPGHLAAAVADYLCANGLDALVIEIADGRRIHVAQGHHRAARAIEALRGAGAVIYADGDHIPVPDSSPVTGDELPSIPPVVVIAAALRSVHRVSARATAQPGRRTRRSAALH